MNTIEFAMQECPSGNITLIGHSSGGIIARLYLSPHKFMGYRFSGIKRVSHLITLGSPHYNIRSTAMRNYVQEKYPDSFFHPDVKYISVAGAAVDGAKVKSLESRIAYYCYKYLCGDGNVKGDGLVPVQTALLRNSNHIVLDDVCHPFIFTRNWYGNPKNVYKWWRKSNSCLGNEKNERNIENGC